MLGRWLIRRSCSYCCKEIKMPVVKGRHYKYTKKGKAAAAKARRAMKKKRKKK